MAMFTLVESESLMFVNVSPSETFLLLDPPASDTKIIPEVSSL